MTEVKFCPNCGNQIFPATYFCAFCGYDLSHVKYVHESVATNNNLARPRVPSARDSRNPLACPVCLQLDQVSKVSALVSSGTFKGTSHGSTWGVGKISGSDTRVDIHSETNYSAQTQTVLSQRLAFWSKISELETIEFWTGGVILFVVFIVGPAMQAIWLSLVVLAATIIYGFAVFNPMKKRVGKETEAAQLRWEKLYYCARDDVTFDPEAGEPVRPEQLRGYLYR